MKRHSLSGAFRGHEVEVERGCGKEERVARGEPISHARLVTRAQEGIETTETRRGEERGGEGRRKERKRGGERREKARRREEERRRGGEEEKRRGGEEERGGERRREEERGGEKREGARRCEEERGGERRGGREGWRDKKEMDGTVMIPRQNGQGARAQRERAHCPVVGRCTWNAQIGERWEDGAAQHCGEGRGRKKRWRLHQSACGFGGRWNGL